MKTRPVPVEEPLPPFVACAGIVAPRAVPSTTTRESEIAARTAGLGMRMEDLRVGWMETSCGTEAVRRQIRSPERSRTGRSTRSAKVFQLGIDPLNMVAQLLAGARVLDQVRRDRAPGQIGRAHV